jgi:hypothetical protein
LRIISATGSLPHLNTVEANPVRSGERDALLSMLEHAMAYLVEDRGIHCGLDLYTDLPSLAARQILARAASDLRM